MARKKNTVGGGKQTNINGLSYEKDTDFLDIIDKQKNLHYTLFETKSKSRAAYIYKSNKLIGYFFEKHSLYKEFFKPRGYDYNEEAKYSLLLPDTVFINEISKTVYIVEKKYQEGGGSVDEKIQTCDYKKNYFYAPKFDRLGYKTEFFWLLSPFYNADKFSDVFSYIKQKRCRYFFNVIPLNEFGL